MSYLISIQRHPEEPIDVADWQAALTASQEFRAQMIGTHTLTNPQTGETISRELGPNDAEYLDPATDVWVVALTWDDEGGRAITRVSGSFDTREDPFRRALVGLAHRLSAAVVGQEGEVYD